MKEMGFRKDASDSVKEAFVKHLIKSATGVDVQTPSEKRLAAQKPKRAQPEALEKRPEPVQLVFDFIKPDEKKKSKVS